MALPGKRDRGDLDRLANAAAQRHYAEQPNGVRHPQAIAWQIETFPDTSLHPESAEAFEEILHRVNLDARWELIAQRDADAACPAARLLVSYVNDAGNIVETSETI